MRNSKIKKIIVGILILGELSLPLLAFGQVLSVPVSDSNNGSNVGSIAGIAVNTATQAALAVPFTAFQACLQTVQVYEQANAVQQLGLSAGAILSGSSILVASLDGAIAAYKTFSVCAQAQLTALAAIPTPNTYTAGIKQQYVTQITAAVQTYKKKSDDLLARQSNANQGFWKTLLISVLLQTSKAVADSLVTKLVSNYKISNLKQYTDSVATLMYDNQYIRDNFPATEDQMMARSILENPLFRTQIQPGIFLAADSSLGYSCGSLSPSDPSFYAKMAQCGSTTANPYFQQTAFVAGVDQSHANAVSAAQQQISQGNGYKAPVNCAGSLAQQQSIDARTKAASDLLANRQALLSNLLAAQAAGQKVSQSDINKAQADVTAATNAWQNLPYSVTGQNDVSNSATGGGNNTEGTAAIVMCEAISSPAVLVNQGINAVFNNYVSSISQYNSNNLPSYINVISGIASQVASSMVLGGAHAGIGTALINENKAVTATVGLAGQAAAASATANLANGIIFTVTPNSSITNGYDINWNVADNTSNLSAASFVTISGDGISSTKTDPTSKKTVPNSFPLSGGTTITSANGGSYVLTVFDANGHALTSATTSTNSQSAYNYNSNQAVLGASTVTPALAIRGPAVVLSPRGE